MSEVEHNESATVIVESVGTYTMNDGREIKGAIISFPDGCTFTASTVWNRERLILSRAPSITVRKE